MIPHIHEKLENWARYRLDKGGNSTSIPWARLITDSNIWNPGHEARIPINLLEAGRTDNCVQALDPVHKKTVSEFYLWTNTIGEKALNCCCSVSQFYRRLDKAHDCIDRMHRDFHRNGIEPRAWPKVEKQNA